MNGNYTATGNFWLWGLECRMNNFSWAVVSVPSTRVEAAEVDTSPNHFVSGGCQITEVTYDPYSGGENQPPCPTDGGGSGIQYFPGDHTGGETVDWTTGVGNGGSSPCGAEAVLEYVCIDLFNEATGVWETLSCGYAAVC